MGRHPTARWSRIDQAGLLVVAIWVAWVTFRSVLAGSALPDVLVYLTPPTFFVLGIALGRILQERCLHAAEHRNQSTDEGSRLFAALLLAVSGYVLVSTVLFGGAGGGPLGYSNANAALGIQLVAVCTIAGLSMRGEPRTWAFAAAILAGLAVPWTLSQAGIALLVPMALAALLAVATPTRRHLWAVPTAILAVGLATAGALHLAGTPGWPSLAQRALGDARQQLWAKGLELWRWAWEAGAGPGDFRAFTPLGVDTDTQRVHMSVIQVGSELGLVGVALFACLAAAWLVLLLTSARGPHRLLGTAAWAALLIHSLVDHLLEFPAVMLLAGLIVGLASARNAPPRSLVIRGRA